MIPTKYYLPVIASGLVPITGIVNFSIGMIQKDMFAITSGLVSIFGWMSLMYVLIDMKEMKQHG